jgi:hypothetical protein
MVFKTRAGRSGCAPDTRHRVGCAGIRLAVIVRTGR